jgi:hypothetical protein
VVYSSLPALTAASGLETNGRRIHRAACLATLVVPGPAPVPIPAQFMTLSPGCAAIDAGLALANINDGYIGLAPDLGAYEAGQPLPRFGPRSVAVPLTPAGLRIVF